MIVRLNIKDGAIRGYHGKFTKEEITFIKEAFNIKYMFVRNPMDQVLKLDVRKLDKY